MTETTQHTFTTDSDAMRHVLSLVLAAYDDDIATLQAAGVGIDGDRGREPVLTALLTFLNHVVPDQIGRPRAVAIIEEIDRHEAQCESSPEAHLQEWEREDSDEITDTLTRDELRALDDFLYGVYVGDINPAMQSAVEKLHAARTARRLCDVTCGENCQKCADAGHPGYPA